MTAQTIFRELKAQQRLPLPSGPALGIINRNQHEHISTQRLAELVETDARLSSRILNFANAVPFGAHTPLTNIQDAILLLGTQTVQNFILGLSLLDNYRQGSCPEFDYSIYWSQALAMAVATAAITARERTIPPEEAFTLGLLSGTGRLAMACAWPENYSESQKPNQTDKLSPQPNTEFGINQKDLCLLLLADWGLPATVLDALALKLSYQPEITDMSRTGRLARQLSFARKISSYCLVDTCYQQEFLAGLEKEACHHAMDKPALLNMLTEIITQWHVWGQELGIKTDVRYSLQQTRQASSSQTSGLDLLLVDDDPMMITRLSKLLTTAGYRVAYCRDGESALKYIFEHQPPLLITDWRMQPMDGISLCNTLRATDLGRKLYIIMLTASESEDDLVDAFNAGIDDYVTKPVSSKVLLSRLHAGQRIVLLQQEVEKEQRDVQRYTAELVANNQRLEQMAYTDMLTDLPNRRYALNRLAQEYEAERRNRPISILMLDLDHFKSINDTLGHDAGDQTLTHVAKLIKLSLRSTDIACRLGGEEFMVIALNTDGPTAMLLAERIRNLIESHQPEGLMLVRPLTVSIGVACATGHKPAWKDLMMQADQALYCVKQSTRNGVRLA